MRKSYRVKKETEFQEVFEARQSVANRQFVLYKMEKPNQKHFRVGISVGKKIGNAVHRNWVKRRIRQSLLELKPFLKQDVDILVIARPTTSEMPMPDIKAHLIHVLKLAKLLDTEYSEED
ncbi:ribonuclease P protein component [Secundilactobacillus paracollinoides]|uniref:Ribonuclease P protein component n=1 Tax=Secundilactobacillus paracollinoides TaxID=240427 RepID=A0A1B2IWZ1_9LACO|nr:ribonuclease P protein component [Secundilactobacillus paracollinoides]ANZ60699.1 ribonuclease P protein component [Secundilactobacillus paracollinoides]ANZ65073.1 ribonuclease P protein component [Secundilactobacillus paracollinoides]ANZ66542.1 ribonuclease P protein component [Secundilactobacillus paracollinoides]KRL79412.1 ribonuclease P protein component [Secundilactobacillus paracollinoides DSM 15502 = JCM 11969]